jgi:gamma-glutamylcyclotransferase (GGCT)/AIG2-like uncharacterized protein YtfP
MTKVFVYGTLLKGFGNHARHLESSKFIGAAVTQKQYTMFKSGIPFVNKEFPNYPIIGEVYEVNAAVLQGLDRLEGHPEWYYREPIPVVLKETGEVITASIYFNDHVANRMLAVGDFKTNEYVDFRKNSVQAPDTQSPAQEPSTTL